MKHSFEKIICADNLLLAWEAFIRGKRKKPDVQQFSLNLMDNILTLHKELLQKTYRHGAYRVFRICDPKQRVIHKATVRDRLLHHAVYRVLYPIYDKSFFADSFSCRLGKGTYKAMARFRKFFYKVSRNNTKTCWVMKCDIKKFFDSVDHSVLLDILEQKISDKNTLWLLAEIIRSFCKREACQLRLFNLCDELQIEREGESKNALRAGSPDRKFNQPAFRQYLSS